MATVTTPLSRGAETASKSARGCQLQPAIFVIFGAGGDLTKRLVIPALYHLVQARKLPDRFAIIGVDHNDQTTEQVPEPDQNDKRARRMGRRGMRWQSTIHAYIRRRF